MTTTGTFQSVFFWMSQSELIFSPLARGHSESKGGFVNVASPRHCCRRDSKNKRTNTRRNESQHDMKAGTMSRLWSQKFSLQHSCVIRERRSSISSERPKPMSEQMLRHAPFVFTLHAHLSLWLIFTHNPYKPYMCCTWFLLYAF